MHAIVSFITFSFLIIYIIGAIKAYVAITDYNHTQALLSPKKRNVVNVFWYLSSWLYFVAPLHEDDSDNSEEKDNNDTPNCSKHFDHYLFNPTSKN